jgi:hypothetical protein
MRYLSLRTVFLFIVTYYHVYALPEQVHIALAGKDGMRIAWFTSENTEYSICRYGTDVTYG